MIVAVLLFVFHCPLVYGKNDIVYINNYCFKYLIGCSHGQVQLVYTNSPRTGLLRICINDTWETVCADDWTTNNTEVVCTQLGYVRGDMPYILLVIIATFRNRI